MGLFDLLSSKMSSDIARHKATKAIADAQISEIEKRSALADTLQQMIDGQSERQSMDTSKPSVSDQMSQMPQYTPGAGIPQFQPNITTTPAVPGQSTGNKLIDMLIPSLVRGGHVGDAAKYIETLDDPKKQMLKQMIQGKNIPALTGGGGNINPNFLTGGSNEMFEQTTFHKIADPNNPGQTIWASVGKHGTKLTPTGDVADIAKPEMQIITNRDGSTTIRRFNPYTGEEVSGKQPSLKIRKNQSETKTYDFTVNKDGTINNIPPGTRMEDVVEGLQAYMAADRRGIEKTPPIAETRIPVQDLKNWKNPQTGKSPTVPMSPNELTTAGFVQYEPLAAGDGAIFPLAVNSISELDNVQKWLMPKGKLNKKNWMKLQGNVGEGVGMRGKLTQAMWAQLRKETGAAVTKGEAEAKVQEYILGLRGIMDEDAIGDGINRLKGNLSGYVNQVDPSGLHRTMMGAKSEGIIKYKRINGKLVKE